MGKVLNVASKTLENEVSMLFPRFLPPFRKADKREQCLTLLLKPWKMKFLCSSACLATF